MKRTCKLLALLMAVAMIASVLAACGGSSKDAFAGTWVENDEEYGATYTWTFDGSGKCTFDNTILSQEGTYKIDESAGTVTIKLELWDAEIVYTYTLTDTALDLNSTYSTYKLTKQ